MKKFSGLLFMVFLLCLATSNASAMSVLSTPAYSGNYGYGGTSWGNMTAALNAATSNHVDVVDNFENLPQMLTYDALWLNIRGSPLTLTEYNNIQSFIATPGKRVVMIGENSDFTSWNQQIIGLNGGIYTNQEADGLATKFIDHELTTGLTTVFLPSSGVVNSGGSALFTPNFATLWGDNVLTVLDYNVFGDDYWDDNNNDVFATNVAYWIAGNSRQPESAIPTLSEWGMIFMSLILAGSALWMIRRRQLS